MEQTRGPDRLEENLAVVMMQVRRSVRAALREAAQSEGLSQNEIEVLLFLAKAAMTPPGTSAASGACPAAW